MVEVITFYVSQKDLQNAKESAACPIDFALARKLELKVSRVATDYDRVWIDGKIYVPSKAMRRYMMIWDKRVKGVNIPKRFIWKAEQENIDVVNS